MHAGSALAAVKEIKPASRTNRRGGRRWESVRTLKVGTLWGIANISATKLNARTMGKSEQVGAVVLTQEKAARNGRKRYHPKQSRLSAMVGKTKGVGLTATKTQRGVG